MMLFENRLSRLSSGQIIVIKIVRLTFKTEISDRVIMVKL